MGILKSTSSISFLLFLEVTQLLESLGLLCVHRSSLAHQSPFAGLSERGVVLWVLIHQVTLGLATVSTLNYNVIVKRIIMKTKNQFYSATILTNFQSG